MMTKTDPEVRQFKFIGQHLDDLADGRIIEPGQVVHLGPDEVNHQHNAQRISEGILIEVEKERE